MQPIIEAVGFDCALRIASHFGGTRVLVSSDPAARDPLAAVIGIEAARALAAAIGAGAFEVPRCTAWLIARRNEEIVARELGGESHAELALRFSLTERHIRNIINEGNLPDCAPHKDLFTNESPASP
ncbi:MAG: hypothetical protein IT502_01915 [Rubrivivax sp.]|nr:hypothetical protein [Rubrivivax sp.]